MTEPRPLAPDDLAKLQALLDGEGHNVLVRLCRSVLGVHTDEVVDHGELKREGVLTILRRLDRARRQGQALHMPLMQGQHSLIDALEACDEDVVRIVSVVCPQARYDVYASRGFDELVGCVRLPSPGARA